MLKIGVQEDGAGGSGANKAEQSAPVEGPSEAQQAEAPPQQEDTVMAEQEPPANESVEQPEIIQDMEQAPADAGEAQPMDAEGCELAAAAVETVDALTEEQQDDQAKDETVVQEAEEHKEAPAPVEQPAPAAAAAAAAAVAPAAAESHIASAATSKSKKRQTMEINKENMSERNGRKSTAAWRKSGVEPVSCHARVFIYTYTHVRTFHRSTSASRWLHGGRAAWSQ